ncbi:hypothetical protein ABT332_13485 [Saccharomonospora azurea]|uniref:hypothetical protein n=1 Tax=Saccharomonospora azurea TaxID=40988 RepID=UPI00331A7AC0
MNVATTLVKAQEVRPGTQVWPTHPGKEDTRTISHVTTQETYRGVEVDWHFRDPGIPPWTFYWDQAVEIAADAPTRPLSDDFATTARVGRVRLALTGAR